MRILIWATTLNLALSLILTAAHFHDWTPQHLPLPLPVRTIGPGYILKLHNASRTEAGLPPLSYNPELQASAAAKARDMVAEGYFGHTDASGRLPWHFFEEAGYDYQEAGENLAEGFTDVYEQHQAWLDSPTHQANILGAQFQDIGIGINGTTVVVHFGDER